MSRGSALLNAKGSFPKGVLSKLSVRLSGRFTVLIFVCVSLGGVKKVAVIAVSDPPPIIMEGKVAFYKNSFLNCNMARQ